MEVEREDRERKSITADVKNRRDRRIMRDRVENASLLWHTNATLINLLLPPSIKKSIRINKGNSKSKPIKSKS